MGRNYNAELRNRGIDPKTYHQWYESQRVQEVKELWRTFSIDGKAEFMAWCDGR